MEQTISPEKDGKRNDPILCVLFEKETADFINGKRMLLFTILIGLITITGFYAALSGLHAETASGESSATFLFLRLFTVSANSIPSYNSLMALMGPFIGIFMGFDAINSERTEGTLNRLVSQPLYRDNIIIGKFLAGLFITAVMVFSSGLLIAAVGLLSTGLVPTGAQIARLFIYLCFCVIYIGFWLAAAILCSTLCRHAATSALACIALWLFCSIFISLLAGIIADALYPVGGNDLQAMLNEVKNYSCQLNLNRLSPYYLFGEATATLLNPSVRSVNAVTVAQLSGALSSTLSVGQSMLLVWPHLTALAALMLIAFAISYVSFMRQEIRSR
ncbi:MAG: ABC transporter permease [Lachnospiraceae bacterium]|nr:ABC transporter permease [Lachnospiraceae bacterium]